MLKGYLIALASGSSLDSNSHNFSLFNLVETLSVPPEALGKILPVEVHWYFLVEPNARQVDFDLRLVRVGSAGAADYGEVLQVRTGDGSRFRARISAFRVPHAYGDFTLNFEWRRRDVKKWNADALRWPLTVSQYGMNTALTKGHD